MRVIERRSGRKLGSYRDARMAHAIHTHIRTARAEQRRVHDKAYRTWLDAYYEGKATRSEAPVWVEPEMPFMQGWRKLGQGSYRTAYLSPKGVVYKVNNDGHDGKRRRGYNYAEVTNIIRIREEMELPRQWSVPDVTLYRVSDSDYVAAMPCLDISAPLNNCYVWGEDCPSCKEHEGNKRMNGKCSSDLLAEGSRLGFSDMHTKNVYPDKEGILWVVDCGL